MGPHAPSHHVPSQSSSHHQTSKLWQKHRLRCARRGKCWPPSRRSWYNWILHWQKLSRWLAVPQRQWWKHRSHYMIYLCWINWIDINMYCMIIFSLCMFSIVKFVRRTMIYANVPWWCLHKHLLWLYDGLPMVLSSHLLFCMTLYDRWLPMLPLLIIVAKSMTSMQLIYKPGKWCGDVTNIGLLSNSRLPYPCFRIVEGGLPLHEIYARSI